MNRRRVLANLLLLGTNQIGTWLLSMVSLVLIGRYLGPDSLGRLALAGALVAVAGLFVSLGMDTLIVRTVARSPERAAEMISAVVVIRLILWAPILAGLYVYTVVAHLTGEVRLATLFLGIGMLLSSLASPFVSAMQGRERMGFPAVMSLLMNLMDLVLVAVVIRLHGGVVLFTALCVPVAAASTVLNIVWASRLARFSLRVGRDAIVAVVRGGFVFWANGVFLTIYIYIDSVILGSFAGTEAVGIYAPALRLFSVGLFLPGIVGAATLPLLSRLGVEGSDDFLRVGRQTLTLLLVGAVPLTIGLATCSGFLISTIYGPSYAASVPVLVIVSFSIVPTFLNVQASQTLIAQDRQGRWTIVMALSCLFNPLLNAVLIPFAEQHWYNGALGAALALLITEILMMLYSVVILRRMLLHPAITRAVLASLLAALVQVTLVWLCWRLWPPFTQAIALGGFAVSALVFEAIPRSEIAPLLHMVRPRRGVQGKVA
jgi:O-antigen/teichoic acid export membrane protein